MKRPIYAYLPTFVDGPQLPLDDAGALQTPQRRHVSLEAPQKASGALQICLSSLVLVDLDF
jgi:hypothetical protein